MRKLIAFLFIVALLVCLLPTAQANLANSSATVLISTSGNTVVVDSLNTISASTTVASTTAVTVTAVTGRDYIEISTGAINSATGDEVWVGIGTSTVSVGTGRLVTTENPLKLPADAGVVFSTIASEAVPMCIIQGLY